MLVKLHDKLCGEVVFQLPIHATAAHTHACSCLPPLQRAPPPARQVPTYGTHHTKMIILKFPTGVRIVVLTANFLVVDVTDKSQAVWYQDFRLQKSEKCDFEVDYVCTCCKRLPCD